MASLKCQAILNFGNAKKTVAPSQSVPLQQPLGYSRPQTSTFATSGALAYGSNLLSATVRKLPIKMESVDAEEVFSSLLGKREASETGRPIFRSALEQVSYETNSSLSQTTGKPQRQTMAGRITRMLRR